MGLGGFLTRVSFGVELKAAEMVAGISADLASGCNPATASSNTRSTSRAIGRRTGSTACARM